MRDRKGEFFERDISTVLDAAGCDRVVLVGSGDEHAIRYAAAHPERVSALVLINCYAHYVRRVDYPWGLPEELVDQYALAAREAWGTGAAVDILCPSKAGDERFRAWWARCERMGTGVDQGAGYMVENFRSDVRALLPALTMPTLVLHRAGNRFIRLGAGQYLADNIEGATYVELPGEDHAFYVGDSDALLDEIEEFLTGSRQSPEGNVVTASILFTDIVASTEHSARLGHRKWITLTEDHDSMVRATLHRHRGREVKTLGDGFLASFDASSRAVRAATEIVAASSGMGLSVRAGVHAGEVEFRSDDVIGLAVSITKRICDLAAPAEVLVSETVKGLTTGSGIRMSDRGVHQLRGVPGTWQLFAIET
jgi:class 3 adenylate cyclase